MSARAARCDRSSRRMRASRIISCFGKRNSLGDNTMEAEQVNAIANSLADLAQRSAELRRYL
ncbi:MAG: hypothetical protein U1F15_16195 [Burkholderiales bacterium]